MRIERVRTGAPQVPGTGSGLTERELRRDLIVAENDELARLYAEGTINEATRQRLQHGLDLDAVRLGDEQH